MQKMGRKISAIGKTSQYRNPTYLHKIITGFGLALYYLCLHTFHPCNTNHSNKHEH